MSETQTEPKSTKPKVYKNVKWALICGILGLLSTLNQTVCVGGLLTLSGLILGILSLLKIRKSDGMLTGHRMALFSLLPFVIYIVLMAVNVTTFYRSIHYAATRGDLADIEAMLDKNPELINKKNKFGYTPLHCAAREGHKEVVEFLCACGADVNTRNKFGKTPLYYATENDHKEVMDFLQKFDGVKNEEVR